MSTNLLCYVTYITLQGNIGRIGDKGMAGDAGPKGVTGQKGETGQRGPHGAQVHIYMHCVQYMYLYH